MPDLTTIEWSTQLLASVRTTWGTHADFAGVSLDAPTLQDPKKREAGDRLVSLAIPEIEFRAIGSEAPKTYIQDAELDVYVLVESAYPEQDISGDPAAAILGILNPLAITTQKRIEQDLRTIHEPAGTPTALENQFYDFNFQGYKAEVDVENARLIGRGLLVYTLGFWVPEYFDDDGLVDLTAADFDYNLYGGVGDTLFPDPPHAEDDETFP